MSAALRILRAHAPGARPRLALLLGSGWGTALDARLQLQACLPYAQLPGFPAPQAGGHAGELRLGRVGGCELALLCGRQHAYDDGRGDGMKAALATLRELGCDTLLQTSAAGSLDPAMPAGSLMVLRDHLNLAQRSPLLGERGDARFVDLADAYDPGLRALAHAAGARAGVPLHEGVYAWMLGPQFETPAEVRMLRLLGADAVGMSTVPETIAARALGMRVLAFSLITNLAAGLTSERLSHAHTLAQAGAAAAAAQALLLAVIDAIQAGAASAVQAR